MVHRKKKRLLITGCNGGAARALLSLLVNAPTGQALAREMETILMADACEQADTPPPQLHNARLLAPVRIESADEFRALLTETRPDQVVELSSSGTIDCIEACEELRVDMLSTSVHDWPQEQSSAMHELILQLLSMQGRNLEGSYIIGAGMNPGVVNVTALLALEEFSRRTGAAPTPQALDLYALYVTEHDTTIALDQELNGKVFEMTWSPTQCLEELFEPEAMIVREGCHMGMGHAPSEAFYSVRCADEHIDAMVVPHEEVTTLSRRFDSVELAFLYRPPPGARMALRAHPTRRDSAKWPTRKLYPPETKSLMGHDRVGVLLCSRRHGELWMGWETDVQEAKRFGTNATEMQVAAGAMAGLRQLGERAGLRFTEDLAQVPFVECVSSVLGPPRVYYDRFAPPKPLVARIINNSP